MKLTLNDLPPHIKKLNPHLFMGSVEKQLTQQNFTAALDSKRRRCKTGKSRLVISLVSYRRKLLDDDNLEGGLKPLRDAIAASIGIDDGDSGLVWKYGQIQTDGQQGTAVKIDLIEPAAALTNGQ